MLGTLHIKKISTWMLKTAKFLFFYIMKLVSNLVSFVVANCLGSPTTHNFFLLFWSTWICLSNKIKLWVLFYFYYQRVSLNITQPWLHHCYLLGQLVPGRFFEWQGHGFEFSWSLHFLVVIFLSGIILQFFDSLVSNII